MREEDIKKQLFDASYSSNTHKVRKEVSKSVFVPHSPTEIKLFNYTSFYELQDKARELLCQKVELDFQTALQKATEELTGLTQTEYNDKIYELYLERKESYKDPRLTIENLNFPLPKLTLETLENETSTNLNHYLPSNMLNSSLKYIKNVSTYNYRKESMYKDTELLQIEKLKTHFSECQSELLDDEVLCFIEYINRIIQKSQAVPENEIHKAANAIGVSQESKEEFFHTAQLLQSILQEAEEDFAYRLLQIYYLFEKELKAYKLEEYKALTLYHGKYAKDFINLYEDNFFKRGDEENHSRKYGVALWAKLESEAQAKTLNYKATPAKLFVTVAKNYFDGDVEAVATLEFNYLICAYKTDRHSEPLHSTEDALRKQLSPQLYRVLRERFYPLFGVDYTQNKGFEHLTKELLNDEEERGGILELVDIQLLQKYSEKSIAEIIKGVYHLIGYSTPPSFPLFASIIGGDILINDEFYPAIKTPLLTLISADFLQKRMMKKERYNEENVYRYYANMSFDALRPILIY
ncbi:MAG: hypothetical protein JXQ67_05775 [Campylobacterales bacterium]|nr:hypothetical protein [Campylobacterales bacterium]